MQHLDLHQASDFLESAAIDKTVDFGFAVVHSGFAPTGQKFVLINNSAGETTLTLEQ